MASVQEPEKSPNDKLEYRLLTFENGFEALLISSSDAQKSKAAASLTVGAGSFSDPQGRCEGLAHFLEHMLFMGSTDYPGEDEFEDFLSRHGGSSNAFTESCRTCYYFEINKAELHKALDMFSGFFRAPLLKRDSADREINAIESEFRLTQNSDSTRAAQALAALAKDGHPYRTFGWGNLKSLKEAPKKVDVDIIDELRKFYETHYSSTKMRLCIFGIEPLDSLEQAVRHSFRELPAGVAVGAGGSQEALLDTAGKPYTSDIFPKLMRIKPVKDVHKLTITWQLPATRHLYKSKPNHYISHVLGHEGAGSLLSWLKKHGLATQLVAGVGDDDFESNSMCSMFCLEVTLTLAGLERWTDVVHSAFIHLDMLRGEGPQQWIHEEIVAVQEMSWRFLEESHPSDYVQHLSCQMLPDQGIERQHLLKATWMTPEWDPVAIVKLLEEMTPNKALIYLLSTAYGRAAGTMEEGDEDDGSAGGDSGERKRKREDEAAEGADDEECSMEEEEGEEQEGDEEEDKEAGDETGEAKDPHFDVETAPPPSVEPFFGAEYWMSDAAELQKLMAEWTQEPPEGSFANLAKADLKLPEPNRFIATDFGMRPPPEASKDVAAELELKRPQCENFPKLPPTLPPCPSLLREARTMRTWHLQDTLFETPRSEVWVKFSTDNPRLDPRSPMALVLLSWLVRFVRELLNETAYLAEQASLYVQMSTSSYGFDLKAGGFSHKLPLLVFAALAEIRALGTKDGWSRHLADMTTVARLNAQREQLLRRYRNAYMRPGEHAADLRRVLLITGYHAAPQFVEALEKCDVDMLVAFATELVPCLQEELLAIGNITAKETMELATQVPAALRENPACIDPAAVPRHPELRVVDLPAGSVAVWVEESPDKGNRNVAVEMYWQLGPAQDAKSRVVADLLDAWMNEPLFDALRTKQQLGYVASCGSRLSSQVSGFSVWLMSAVACPADICEKVEEFLKSFREVMVKDEKTFLDHVCALAAQKLEPPRTLSDVQGKAWTELSERQYVFDRNIQEVKMLAEVTIDDVVQVLDRIVGPAGAPSRAGMIITAVVGGKAKTTAADELRAFTSTYSAARVVSSKDEFLKDAKMYDCLV